MKDLEPPDIHHFSAAEGWLGLSSPHDAQAELDNISKAQQSHLAVMELQWQVHAKAKHWRYLASLTLEFPLYELRRVALALNGAAVENAKTRM